MHEDQTVNSGVLSEMTVEDVKHLSPEVVVIPIGSTEPHGPHLPYGTDCYQVEAVGRGAVAQANARQARVLLYPTLPVSNNVNFQAFAFACRINVRTLMLVLLDMIEALEQDGVRKVVLLNGHGGNPDTLRATIREHVGRRRPGQGAFVCMVDTPTFLPAEIRQVIEHPSEHAGESETSRMLHVRPDLVRPEKQGDFPIRKPALEALRHGQVFYVKPWHAYMPDIAGGETRKASAEKGKHLTQGGAKILADFLVELSASPMHELFPFPPMP